MTARGAAPPSRGGSPQAVDAIEDLIASVLFALVGAIAAVAVTVLAGAQLAAVVFGAGEFDAGLSDAVDATIALPSHSTSPADAWPESVRAHIPGPVPYWTCKIAVLVAVGASA